jgi:WhiB family transcriptional regulator, redox-sensing transcriptional regulator
MWEGAACIGHDPELWDGLDGGNSQIDRGHLKTQTAEAICRGCEIREKCLSFALEENIEFSIWGGLTPLERRRLKE